MHPEWFEDSLEVLVSLIEAEYNAHVKSLQTCLVADKKEFRHCQRKVGIAGGQKKMDM